MNVHQEKAGGTLMFCGMEYLFAAGIQDVIWKFSKRKFEVRNTKYEDFLGVEEGLESVSCIVQWDTRRNAERICWHLPH
jgi:hypothetical protein